MPGAALSTTNSTIGPADFSFGKFESCHDLTADVSYHHFMSYLKLNHYVFYRANTWNFIHILLDQVQDLSHSNQMNHAQAYHPLGQSLCFSGPSEHILLIPTFKLLLSHCTFQECDSMVSALIYI